MFYVLCHCLFRDVYFIPLVKFYLYFSCRMMSRYLVFLLPTTLMVNAGLRILNPIFLIYWKAALSSKMLWMVS